MENELRQHYDDVPRGNLDAIAREAVFGAAHPYGSTTIGRVVSAEEVCASAERHLARDETRLVVVGDASKIVPALRTLDAGELSVR